MDKKKIKVNGKLIKERRIRKERRRELRHEIENLREKVRRVTMGLDSLKFDKKNWHDSAFRLRQMMDYLQDGIEQVQEQKKKEIEEKGND